MVQSMAKLESQPKVKSKRQQRQARAIDEINQADIEFMLNFFGHRCVYCNVQLTRQEGFDNTLHVDHYLSLSEQDENDEMQILQGLTIANALPSCRECNLKKSNTNPEVWIRSYCPNADEVFDRIEAYFSLNQESRFL